jgi:hypothetical protein
MEMNQIKTINMLLLLCLSSSIYAQSGIVISETEKDADPSAILEVQSTTQGVLMPRVTLTQRDAIANPALGLLVYQTNEIAGFHYYDGSVWTLMGSAKVSSPTANDLQFLTSQDVVLSATGSGEGDLVFYDDTDTQLGTYTMNTGNETGTHNAGTYSAGTYTFKVKEVYGGCTSVYVVFTVTVQ